MKCCTCESGQLNQFPEMRPNTDKIDRLGSTSKKGTPPHGRPCLFNPPSACRTRTYTLRGSSWLSREQDHDAPRNLVLLLAAHSDVG